MSPGKRSAGLRSPETGTPTEITPPPSDTITTKRTARHRRPTVVRAVRYLPNGRRTTALFVVEHCPFCPTGGHAHRGVKAVPGVRRAGCGRGTYRLDPWPADIRAVAA